MNTSPQPEPLVPLHAWSEPVAEARSAPSTSRLRLGLEAAAFATCVGVATAVLVSSSTRDVLAFPFSDAHDWAAEVLRSEPSIAWAHYLWRPHGEQRIPWARLAEALSLERPARPAFLLIGAALWGLGLAAFAGLLARSAAPARVRLWVGAAAAMLVTCAALVEDFAFPVFSVYVFAAGPALAAACLWAPAGEVSLRSAGFWAALFCAALGSGGNAAGLAVWPALLGATVLAGETGAAVWVLIAASLGCGLLMEAGLGAPGGTPAVQTSGAARLVQMVIYFGDYCALPWSRILRAPWLGALVGWGIAGAAAIGMSGAHRRRMRLDRSRSLRNAGTALALFGLATAALATSGRVDELPRPIVPTRYTPFALLLQVALLLLHADVLERWLGRRPLVVSAAVAAAFALILASDLRGARLLDETADRLRADSRAFDAGLPTQTPMYPEPERAHGVRRALIARGLPG